MCLDDKTLSAYIDGELSEPWKTQVDEHLVHCSVCRHRYNQLVLLEKDIKSARIQDYEFEEQKNRVWMYLKKHVVSEEPKRFTKRRFYISAPMLMAAAAALVLLFAVNFLVVRNIAQTQSGDINSIPVISSAPRENGTAPARGEMIQVSASDSVAVARALENLSIEQILKILDERGFEVDLRLKNVKELPAALQINNATPTVDAPAAESSADQAAVPEEPDPDSPVIQK
jgi:anti-sigma factor RsiW